MMAVRDAASELRTLARGIDHPEAVAWWGGAVWCGTEGGQLVRIDPSTGNGRLAAQTDGFLLGLAFDQLGRCYACDSGKGRLLRIGVDGSVEPLLEEVEGRKLITPNYPVFTSDGSLYVSESGSSWDSDDGYLFRLRADGTAEVVDEECKRFPNGLAMSADERTLFVVESRLPGIVTYALAGGRVGPRVELVGMPETVPDGLALDSCGGLYVGCWRPDRIYRIALENGHTDLFLDDPTAEYMNSPTNVCFGGPGLTRMYVAGLCGWAIKELDVECGGQRLVYPAVP